MADLYEAYLDDIQLQLETIEDQFGKVIAKYSYPYADGDDLEDMGQKGHSTRLRAYFIDEGDRLAYDDHIKLINHLADKTDFILYHPKYGIIHGLVEDVTARHDDRQRCAEVDFTFLEQMRQPIDTAPDMDVASAVESHFLTGQDEQIFEAVRDVVSLGLPPEIPLDATNSIMAQIKVASGSLRIIAKEVDDHIAMLRATAIEIIQPVNSLVATITYTTTIPGLLIGTATFCVERVARLYDSVADAPAHYLANLDFAFKQLIQAAGDLPGTGTAPGQQARTILIKHLQLACSQRLALESAYSYATDESRRQLVRKAEKQVSFDILGRYLSPAATDPLMNLRELENTLATSRAWLQDGVTAARSMQSLKDLALDLLTHVSSVKLEREKIITVTVINPTPLHLICLIYGLPYNYAERIRGINPHMANPNAVSGDIQIYVC
ncbi:MAG: DNA circularization N-terminal domain-containing protein [Desulfobacteraceae bacterium]|nr:DNA circularization N-terminal domain-containing protein [Desulfobacteraceae bacterium]